MAKVIEIVILVVIFVLVLVVLPRWGVRRAVPSVIRIFRERNAVGRGNAKTIDELELKPPKRNVIAMMFAPRDYRLDALGALMKAKVAQRTEDGKFYLSEEDLVASKWKDL